MGSIRWFISGSDGDEKSGEGEKKEEERKEEKGLFGDGVMTVVNVFRRGRVKKYSFFARKKAF